MTSKPPEVPDFHLWSDVARNIRPLNPRRRMSAAMEQPTVPDRMSYEPLPAIRQHGPPPRREPPPLTGLDRRSERRLSRGQVEIEGRLDLHGTGIEESRWRLLQFLKGARGRGVRLVLVITGKGDSPFAGHTLHGVSHFHSPERQGRLRRLVPEWLHEPEFRAHVAGFQPAHPRHGGGGAYYVRLRRTQRHES